MKRYIIGIITTIMLIITLCSCSAESTNNESKMIKLTAITSIHTYKVDETHNEEIYVNTDNIIAIYSKEYTTQDGITINGSILYCVSTVTNSHSILIKESPEDIMKLINN